MRALIINISLLFFVSSFGQNKSNYNIVSSNGDTTFWYKYQMKQIKKLSLPSLDTNSNVEYFRVWTNKQVIQVWQNQGGKICGNITTWTDEYTPYNEKPTNRAFVKVKSLNNDTAKLIRQLFFSSGILSLPTDDSIKGWQQGLDGITYFIENSSLNSYFFKSYWTPTAQDSLSEAIQVQKFVDSVFLLVKAGNIWKSFVNEIPYESYYNGGPSVAIRVLTNKQRKKYAKERKAYRQNVYSCNQDRHSALQQQ